jgi:hypothetical protein
MSVTESVAVAPGRQQGISDILIVRHGPGRGREPTFLPLFLETVARTRPGLSKAIRVYETGAPMPSLDGVGVVAFFLGDPIFLYPDCEADAVRIAAAAHARGIRLLNRPRALNNTVKSRQAELWRRAGIPCAAGQTGENAEAVRAILQKSRFPVILRQDTEHAQRTMSVCASMEEAEKALKTLKFPAAVLEFVDTRESWRKADPESIYATYFHKKRSMVFGSTVINNHVYFASEPIVGKKTSTFKQIQRGKAPERARDTIAADIAFAWAPTEHEETIRNAVRVLGLHFAAIDFSTFADGSVILWEANPYFELKPVPECLLWKLRGLTDRNERYIDAMADGLAAAAGRGNG